MGLILSPNSRAPYWAQPLELDAKQEAEDVGVIDKSTIVISETASEDELWAEACLRVGTFNELNHSSYNIQITEDTWPSVSSRPLRIEFQERGKVLRGYPVLTLPFHFRNYNLFRGFMLCISLMGYKTELWWGALISTNAVGFLMKSLEQNHRAYLSNACVARELHCNGVGYILNEKSKGVAREWVGSSKRALSQRGKLDTSTGHNGSSSGSPSLLPPEPCPDSQALGKNMKGLEMVVTSFSSTPPLFFSSPLSSSNLRGRFTIPSSPSSLLNGLRRHQDAKLVGTRARGGAVRVLANPNASSPPPGKVKAKKEVIMVDPVEAKRLASKQMEEIKGRERQQRRREVEAINGAWAIIGLLIGLVIEAQTGKGILAQLDGYWSAVLHLFTSSAQI
ncbi:hypothetical protein IGI04_001769 [Brassica rapa subsp. trilocularis]|uniref:Uncharacterized protein n=1 Tax=Brassica rapa subsp. trilocularis TaxID=1813537 RepID=A0ABQ7NTP5_BRACM|nr:hypothetical protein IGI04_001769 [Brassica rapa subsp. trilocularis]